MENLDQFDKDLPCFQHVNIIVIKILQQSFKLLVDAHLANVVRCSEWTWLSEATFKLQTIKFN